jgi:hypothetical protein
VDSPARLAFIACDINSALLTVDMNTWRVTGTAIVGVEPDVLAFDGHASPAAWRPLRRRIWRADRKPNSS